MPRQPVRINIPAAPAFAALMLALPLLQGCFPVIAGGVAAGVMAVDDRRSLGTQADDKTIGVKVDSRINDVYGDRVHVNINPYNRRVLLTGEVPDEKTRADVGRIAAGVENVTAVINEVQVGINASGVARSNDAIITSLVKGNLVDTPNLSANSFKVVTEANVVYLMGLVTRDEGDRASQAAARTRGVAKVVRVFEYIEQAPRKSDAPAR
jgi:osmotically-inducible protein OsmY